ncbi:MAG: hypothetical protein HQ567_21335 [Candidatus Nealsonbacteria bacterium]|nr:hypothetical protein [Candidatus Nealsonbacteria bacterium]
MSRRKKRPIAGNSEAAPSPPDPMPSVVPTAPLRKRPWLLAIAALLQAGWLGFLIAMAWKGP